MEKKYENSVKEGEEKVNKLQETINDLQAAISKAEKLVELVLVLASIYYKHNFSTL